MIKKLLAVSVLFLLILCPLSAGAVPSLGVAPGLDENWDPTGTYNGLLDGENDYLTFFAADFDYIGGNVSFVVPPSGGQLAVWFGQMNTNGLSNDEKLYSIFLATDAPGAIDGGFFFDGVAFGEIEGGKVNGYFYQEDGNFITPNYWGVEIGSVFKNDNGDFILNDGWTLIDAWPGEVYYYQGEIVYDDFLAYQEDWFFAFADANDNGILDDSGWFSPHTTSSANPVPEPATMLLFGSGLIGLAALGKKKFRKN